MQPRFGDDLGRRAAGPDLAIEDIGHAIAVLLHLVEVMRADHRRHAVRGLGLHDAPEEAARLRIHAAGRLIEQQQLRPVQQRAGKRKPLLPAAGERAGELAPVRLQREAFDDAFDVIGRGFLRHRKGAHDKAQVLLDGQIVIQAEMLRHVADQRPQAALLASQIEAEALTGAMIRRQQAAEHAHRRCLAAAVGAEKGEEFAAADAEAQTAYRRPAGEGLAQFMDLDGLHVGFREARHPPAGRDAAAAVAAAISRPRHDRREKRAYPRNR